MDLTRCGLPIALAFLCVLSAIPVATSAGNGDHASRDKPPSVQLQTIEIDGVDTPLAQRLARGVSLTREPADGSRHPARLNRLAGEAVDEMQTMLSALGYRQARVVLIANPQPDMTSPARYRVTLGEPLRYRAFDLTMTLPPIKDPELIAGVELAREPLRAGAVVDQERYEQEKNRLLALARERGYFAARFTRHEILIDPEQYEAQGRLHFDPGVRSRFGEVRIAESHLDPSLVQRMIRIQPGDPYQNRVLLLQEQALMDSDYFSSVSVSPSVAMQGPIKTLPLTVVTTPRNRHRYQAGAGVTTDIGPRLSVGWLNRYLNRQGHRLGLEGAAAPVQSSLEGEYRIPIRDPLQDSLQLRAGWSSTDSDSRESELFETSVERSIARGPWREGISLRALQERFDAGDDEGRSFLLVPGIRWERLWNDRPQFPRRGYRFALGLHGSAETLLSDADFVQATLSLGYLHAVTERTRLILRGDLGATATADFEDLPASYRFFAGGDRSLRGFDFETAGPQDDDGDVIGGRYLAVGSLEIDHRFGESWGGALFYDFGGAFNHRQQPVEHAVGTGLRLFTPIGTLRLDLAAAISRNGLPWRLHLSVGPDL